MGITRRITAFLAVVTSLAGCAPPPVPASRAGADPQPAPAEMLGNSSLQSLYGTAHREDGVVLHGSHVGARWTKWVKPDGSMQLLAGAGLFTDTGRVVVVGDTVCSTWQHIDGGKTSCMRVGRIAVDTYVSYGADQVSGSRFRVSIPGLPPD